MTEKQTEQFNKKYNKDTVKAMVSKGVQSFMKETGDSFRTLGIKLGISNHRVLHDYYHGRKEPHLTNYLKMVKIGIQFKVGF